MNTSFDAVVLDHWPAQDHILAESDFDPAMMQAGGKPMLERIIARLADSGYRQILVVLGNFPASHRNFLADGTRWGVSIRYTYACRQGTPLRLVANMLQTQQGQITLACADTLLHEQDVLDDDHVCCYLNEGVVCWSGWARLPASEAARLLKVSANRAALEEAMIADHNLCRYKDHAPLSSACASDIINLPHQIFQRHMLKPHTGESPRLSQVAADAHIIQPVYIGQNVLIGAGCEIGPNVIIEDNCMISQGCQISNSSIATGTYLGQSLLIRDAHVTPSAILKADHQVSIPKNDYEILGAVEETMPVGITVGERCAGIALWLISTPASFYLKHFSSRDLPPKLQKLVEIQEKLPKVFRGKMALFGLTHRSETELVLLPPEWKSLYQKHRVGVLNEAIFLSENDITNETAFFADIKSTRRSSIREKYRIVSYFLSGVWGAKTALHSA
ncbi:hypothetical protein [Undibacterium squillarum]|uniref:Mannose-1-phosphate guanyltransferase C-terminal domain-containing protein n=1 Tax=Undibacterium squillarum TaxID=1131567 RepID=A0ABQ2XVR2_9BURK|nr:hypothetical protein [Undibacterium squillarum]GGX36584.1 hypothetical protein GCM10010946_13030 [Undibacterium squillarum]